MNKSKSYGPDQITVKIPSPEMTRITSLISETESLVVQIEAELIEIRRTLSSSEATKTLDPSDRSAPIKAGLAKSRLEQREVELSESRRLLEGLAGKLEEAEQIEKERLYAEFVARVTSEGKRLLGLIDRLEANIYTHNDLVGEIQAVMEKFFWREDAEKLLNTAGCRLPNGTLQRLTSILSDLRPGFRSGNFFLDKLRVFCCEESESKLPQLASPAR